MFCQGLCFPQLSLLSEAAFLPLLIKTGKKNNYHFSRLKVRKEICPSWELSGWRLRGTSPAAGSTAGTEHLSTGVSTSTKNVPKAHLEGQTQGGRGPSHPAAHLAQEQTDGCEAAQGPPPAQPRANSQCECRPVPWPPCEQSGGTQAERQRLGGPRLGFQGNASVQSGTHLEVTAAQSRLPLTEHTACLSLGRSWAGSLWRARPARHRCL